MLLPLAAEAAAPAALGVLGYDTRLRRGAIFLDMSASATLEGSTSCTRVYTDMWVGVFANARRCDVFFQV